MSIRFQKRNMLASKIQQQESASSVVDTVLNTANKTITEIRTTVTDGVLCINTYQNGKLLISEKSYLPGDTSKSYLPSDTSKSYLPSDTSNEPSKQQNTYATLLTESSKILSSL